MIKQNNRGFTLIELLVSIALFSIVMTVALGSIITIADSNKKARSMMQVMNNLNFAVDSMTRSFKSGEIRDLTGGVITDSGQCFQTYEADYSGGAPGKRFVKYCVINETLTKQTGNTASSVDLTSSDVRILNHHFELYGNLPGQQPMLGIVLDGEVRITPTISSQFTINTSVAQRNLNIQDEDDPE